MRERGLFNFIDVANGAGNVSRNNVKQYDSMGNWLTAPEALMANERARVVQLY